MTTLTSGDLLRENDTTLRPAAAPGRGPGLARTRPTLLLWRASGSGGCGPHTQYPPSTRGSTLWAPLATMIGPREESADPGRPIRMSLEGTPTRAGLFLSYLVLQVPKVNPGSQ